MRLHTQNGFTIIELMITITVFAVLLAVGVPNMIDFVRNNRITATVNDLVAATTVARSEAIKRRANVTVCPSADATAATPTCETGGTADWAAGWVVFADTDGDATIDGGEEILQQHGPAGGSIGIATDAAIAEYVSFARSGLTRTTAGGSLTGNLLVCDERGLLSQGSVYVARALAISRIGRPQVHKDKTIIDAMGLACP